MQRHYAKQMHFHSVLFELLLDITIRPPKQFRRVLVCFAYNKQVRYILHTESNSLKLSTFWVCQSLVRSGPLSRWQFKEVLLNRAKQSNTTLTFFFGISFSSQFVHKLDIVFFVFRTLQGSSLEIFKTSYCHHKIFEQLRLLLKRHWHSILCFSVFLIASSII